ncbi:MAG: PRC-barrel domain-containing protein [Kiritimatiellia bacterium]
MQRSISRLMGCSVRARDGAIGVVNDFYFDDHAWVIRYMVVGTDGWLSGREVLISTAALKKPVWKARTFPVDLTRKQVRDSPGIDTHKPVSRSHEDELSAYYGWPVYWTANPLLGMGYPVAMQIPPPPLKRRKKATPADSHLRSVSQVTGYNVRASDGELGHVQDFIVDDRTWDLRYMVVNTRNWLPGKKVLICPKWIRSVNWKEAKVSVSLTGRAIRESPEYDPSKPVTEDYHRRLHLHYGGTPARRVSAGVS